LVDEKNRVIVNREAGSRVEEIDPPEKYMWQGSSTGMVVMNTGSISSYHQEPDKHTISLYSDFLGEIGRRKKLYAYDNGGKFFMDIGTPETYGKMKRHPILKDILDHRSS
jgi:choline kinase